MRDYILRRLLLVPVTLFGISVITFMIIRLAPGDPAEMKVSPGVGGEQQADKNVSKEIYERTLEQFDLDKPRHMQYLRWVGKLCGIDVQVEGAKNVYKAEVLALLVEKYKGISAPQIEKRKGEIEVSVAKEAKLAIRARDARLQRDLNEGTSPDPEFVKQEAAKFEARYGPAGQEARAEKQLNAWIKAQAADQRFKYGDEINTIRARFRTEYGDDFESYFSWKGLALNRTQDGGWYPLDFGRSFKDDREVLVILKEKIPRSLELSLFSIFLAYVIAIPIGIHSSVSQGKLSDQVITTTLFVLYSLPSFWVAIMLLLLVSAGGVFLRWFPVGGLGPDVTDPISLFEHLFHLVLPVFCLTYASFAYISRQMRAGMLEVIRQDFIRTARAKGLPEHVVILKHALRNGMIPLITIVAVILPALIGGSVIIETIFNIDGVGQLSFTAILTRDYPIIMAIFTLSALLTLFGILLSDVLYVIVDPQISFEGK
ncbi:MAG: ABC transporter permease [Planctomycetes bacterium]|nr:ABC transporter permease [Planctomycetota bacterium]